MRPGILISILAIAICATTRGAVTLPMRTVFKGQDRFQQLVVRAKAENWKALPIGQRTAAVGQAMVGTPYRSLTLEIDNRVESPSVNFTGHDRSLVRIRRLLRPLAEMEAEVSSRSLYEIPKGRVAAIESRLRSGDISGIGSRDGRHTSVRATSHVGLALRTAGGTSRFVHASAPHNYGRVVIDTR